MTDAGRRAGFPQEPKPRRFIVEISLTNHFQSDQAPKIDVEGFVSDAHGTSTELDWCTVIAFHEFIILKR